jgi:hypothetical protein
VHQTVLWVVKRRSLEGGTNVSEEITTFVFRIEVCGSVCFTEAEPEFLDSNTAMVLYCTLRA